MTVSDGSRGHTRTVRSAGLLLAFVVVFAGLGQTPVGGTVLRAAGLVADPTRYTELAFVTPQALPAQITSGTALPHAQFEIHNLTKTAQKYR